MKNMPRRDGTGPDGKGQQAGRGQGPCGQNRPTQGQGGKRSGRGQGTGGGRGRGQGQGRGGGGRGQNR
ncbi:conserved hypothetical protein [Desulfosarcina cetonica]|nr:conserved hypothetical protein [Desulfosarcina cetonica]